MTFSAAEYQAVEERAAVAGLTVPSYLAVAAVMPDGVASTDARSALTNLVGTRRVLAGAASNLNQLTAKLHVTGEVDEALPAVLAAVQRLTRRVDDAVEQVATVVGRR